jgi:hypothetical protein
LKARGKDVLLPVGCSDFDEWLLDALSVERLLKQLRSDPPTLDLINACVSASTLSPGRSSLATPPRGSSSLAAAGEEGGIVDFRTLMSREGTPGGTPATVPAAAADDDEDSRAPRLRLRSLQVGARGGHIAAPAALACMLSVSQQSIRGAPLRSFADCPAPPACPAVAAGSMSLTPTRIRPAALLSMPSTHAHSLA